MLTKTVTGRKMLNAMLRHIAFHGSVEFPCTYRQHVENNVLKQLQADGKITSTRNNRGEFILVSRNAMPYEESVSDLFENVEPLVVHLALDNPRNEQLAKVFRANHVVPVLREVEYTEFDPMLDID